MSAPLSFGARLRAAMDKQGQLCAGIDPHASLLQAWGLGDDLEGLRRFADICVGALAGQVAVIKPQVAFFERFGSAGLAVLEDTIAGVQAGGSLCLVDAKRGDIGSTMAAYAQAFVGDCALAGDAVTVSPYLGVGALAPVIELAEANGRGVIVLARTSNPQGEALQLSRNQAGVSVAQQVIDEVGALNAGVQPLGSHGVVIGVTSGTTSGGLDLSGLNGVILAPGFGAQGGSAQDLAREFAGCQRNVLVASSRDVLSAGPDVTRLRDAAHRCADTVDAALACP